MIKFNAKNLAIVVFLGALLVGIIGIVNAQEALPKGGDGFETAVEIEPGSYVTDHDISRKVPEYFKLAVGAGQILAVKVTNLPTGVDIISHTVLYNEDRVMLLPNYDNPLSNIYGAGLIGTYKWLPNSSQDSYVYYISVGGGEVNFTAEGTKYDISIEDRFDAGSQTDAGDSFEKAMSVTTGEYTAYLSGEAGTDTKDFYKIVVKKGETLTVKVTPPSATAMRVVVYDSNRGALKDERAPNLGAIVTNSVSIAKSGDVFIAVICGEYCSENVVKYTSDVAIQPPAGAREPVGEEEEEEEIILPSGEGVPTGEGPEVTMPVGAEEVAKAVGKGIAAGIIFWIVGPIITLVIIGVVVYFLLKKKK